MGKEAYIEGHNQEFDLKKALRRSARAIAVAAVVAVGADLAVGAAQTGSDFGKCWKNQATSPDWADRDRAWTEVGCVGVGQVAEGYYEENGNRVDFVDVYTPLTGAFRLP